MNKTVEDLAARWLTRERADLTHIEDKVLQSAVDRRPISRDSNESFDETLSFGDRLADNVARFGGSWTFIVGFVVFLVVWAVTNVWLLTADPFDPYPFIFLNLLLSMIAALQAPIIMMSQNRQSERDRQAAAHDYAVNLKAEIEIMALHEKLDEMRHREIVAMHGRIEAIAASVARIEDRLGPSGQSPI